MAGMFTGLGLTQSQRNALKLAYNNPNTPPAIRDELARYDSGSLGGLSSQALAYLNNVSNAGTAYGGGFIDNVDMIDPAVAGYAGNSPVGGLDPYSAAALNSMVGAQGQISAAQAAAQGNIGSAYYNALGNVQAAQAAANASMNNAAKGLEGSNYSADAQKAIQSMISDAQKNIQTQIDNTNLDPNGLYATQRYGADAAANAQVNSALLPTQAKLQALMALLGGGSGVSGTGLGGGLGGLGGSLSGLGGSLGSALGALGAGGNTSTTGGNGTSTATTNTGLGLGQAVFGNQAYSAPPLASYIPYDNHQLGVLDAQQAGQISGDYGTTAKDLMNNTGLHGFSYNRSGTKAEGQWLNNQNRANIVSQQGQNLFNQYNKNQTAMNQAQQLAAQQYANQQDIASRIYTANQLNKTQLQNTLLNGLA